MGGQFHKQTYVKTRVAIMAARLMPEAVRDDLPQGSLEDTGRRFGLQDLLSESLPAASLNRAVERAMIQSLTFDYSVLLRPFTGAERQVLQYWIRKFELFNIKALIRGKINALEDAQIADQLHELPPSITLPHEELLRTDNVLELLRRLEQGAYREIARQARQVYEERNEPFSLDATIDRLYYAGLLKRISATEPQDREGLREVIGTLIDHQNLLWLLRYRFAYGLPAAETFYLMIPRGQSLNHAALLRLVEVSNFADLIEQLPPSLHRWLEGAENTTEVQRRLERRGRDRVARTLKQSPSGVAQALAYLVLREMDLRLLFVIIQGKVLELPEELLRYAGGQPGSAEENWA